MKAKLLLVGWGRAGKDCAAEFMNDHLGLPYAGSTSWAALPLMATFLNVHPQTAWEHRHENRQLWKDTCDGFRAKEGPLFLVRRALESGQVVTGVRGKSEIVAARESGWFRHIVWIERPGLPLDETVGFGPGDCTDYIRNDGSLRRFHRNLTTWACSVGLDNDLSPYAEELLGDLDP